MATCAAIHGLALYQPDGWERVTARAADWLEGQQEKEGCWYVQGGPTVMLTVLVLDSISLGRGNNQATFVGAKGLVKEAVAHDTLPVTGKVEPTYNYASADWYNPQLPAMKFTKLSRIHEIISPQIAMVVATEVELKQVLRVLAPPPRKMKIHRASFGNFTYYAGRFGAFECIVTRCSMGIEGATGATLTAAEIIREWSPQALIMPGIAFGASRKRHLPADVLVARYIVPYEHQRVSDRTIYRNPIPPSSPALVNRFENAMGWVFSRPDDSRCKVHVGTILSGSKLVDSLEFKTRLLEQYPTALGGEMEGAGIWSAADAKGTHWILVKGVCDWGDGNKHDDYQQMAAAASVSLCHHVLSDAYTLDGL